VSPHIGHLTKGPNVVFDESCTTGSDSVVCCDTLVAGHSVPVTAYFLALPVRDSFFYTDVSR